MDSASVLKGKLSWLGRCTWPWPCVCMVDPTVEIYQGTSREVDRYIMLYCQNVENAGVYITLHFWHYICYRSFYPLRNIKIGTKSELYSRYILNIF
ncbi:hypothetical protein SCLCIDRAFT_1029164 [Scleroderma citrinum Foug A]|uniref:Uncharacterized protein n=1 Tax=Scleroderma citrinum Foug A TaxID=1036808 RepID=A0A0C2ZBW4_9AGAM|nr:hypothetical protein SCLCIDRAFT_1029164 [Scleroderma citrinum Foug A]